MMILCGSLHEFKLFLVLSCLKLFVSFVSSLFYGYVALFEVVQDGSLWAVFSLYALLLISLRYFCFQVASKFSTLFSLVSCRSDGSQMFLDCSSC